MNEANNKLFEFTASGWNDNHFSVVNFSGKEALSTLYCFSITISCHDLCLDIDDLLGSTCLFSIHNSFGEKRRFHGILSSINLLAEHHSVLYLKVELVPGVWVLSLGAGCRVFLNKSVLEIIQEVLEDYDQNNFMPDFRQEVNGNYLKQEYICQYNESAFNFISRLMEKHGLYYYFSQEDSGEVLCIADNMEVHRTIGTINYAPPSGLENTESEDVITSFSVEARRLPKLVRCRGFDEQRPDLLPEGKADIYDSGHGSVYTYGKKYKTGVEAAKQAEIISQQIKCQSVLSKGDSSNILLESGRIFTLNDYFLKQLNEKYLIVSVVHEGGQAFNLPFELNDPQEYGASESGFFYHNQFTCLSSQVQYRHPVTTVRPEIPGSISAWIDADGSGEYAMLDSQGRYKIIMPFDLSERGEGRASHWVRMVQPYGGKDHGMHFPLLKNTEVLLTFIDGDPDHPVIQGVVPNQYNPSLVNGNNHTVNRLKTAGGTEIIMDDTDGKQRVTFQCQGAVITLGSSE